MRIKNGARNARLAILGKLGQIWLCCTCTDAPCDFTQPGVAGLRPSGTELLVDLGMDPLEALKSGTSVDAELLAVSAMPGSLEPYFFLEEIVYR